MELGTYKVIKRPNQHFKLVRNIYYWFIKTKIGKWVKEILTKIYIFIKYLLKLVMFGTIGTALVLSGVLIDRLAKPEHILAQVIEVKELPPILKKICKAESQNRQFRDDKGHVLRGSTTPSDIGYCQINEIYWNDTAKDLGYDIYTEKGNKEMAMYIFENEGTTPWNSSRCTKDRIKNCWK